MAGDSRSSEVNKMTKKKKRQLGVPSILKPKFSNKVVGKLYEASVLIDEDRTAEAAQILEPLYRDFPREPQVLKMVALLRIQQDDRSEALNLMRKALVLLPQDAETHIMMVGLEVELGYLSLACEDLKPLRVSRLDADDKKRYQRLYELLDGFKKFRRESTIDLPGDDDDIRLEAINDRCILNLRNGNLRQAEKYARELLALQPANMPARNNLSEILFQQHKMEESLKEVRQALVIAPENQYTVALALRTGYLLGDKESLDLCVAPVISEHHYAKQIEGLLFKGDLDTIVAWHPSIVSLGNDGPFDRTVALRMLACVLIKKELFKEAQDVIALMAKERRGALSDVGVGINTVLPTAFVSGIGTVAHENIVKSVVQQPWFVLAINFLIRYGDVRGLAFGIGAAEQFALPAFIPALTEFAAEDRGTEQQRIQASRCIDKINGVAQAKHIVFIKGAKVDVRTSKIVVKNEQMRSHSDPKLEAIYSEVVRLGNLGKSQEVAVLLEQARELGDTGCTLRFNYASSLLQNGKKKEGMAIIRSLHAEDPEYLFARTQVVQEAVEEGRLEEAQALLEPLFLRTEFHVTEYRAFLAAQVILVLAMGEVETAKGCVEALEQVLDEGDLVLAQLRWLVESGERKVVGG